MNHTALELIELGAVFLGLGLLGRLAGRIGMSPIPLYLIGGVCFGTGGIVPLATSATSPRSRAKWAWCCCSCCSAWSTRRPS